MDEKELKTSPKQRIFIILIAVLMLGSIIASYIAIVVGNSSGKTGEDDSGIDKAKIAEYEEAYNKIKEKFTEETKNDFERFSAYRSEIKAYNETAANENGIATRDLESGFGKELVDGDTDYLAYYVGWCADESVFDSSFDDNKNPTGFASVLDPSLGMIEGWNVGIEGMKIGGIREVTIPSELAYGDSMEICGGKNKPLKFIIMAMAKEEPLKSLASELDIARMRLQYATYGLDYDSMPQE